MGKIKVVLTIVAVIMLFLCIIGRMDYKLLLIIGTLICIYDKRNNSRNK